MNGITGLTNYYCPGDSISASVLYTNTAGTNCLADGSASLVAPANSPVVCLGDAVTLAAGTTIVDAQVETIVHYDQCPDGITYSGNAPVYEVTWTASVGSWSASGTGTTATFTPTNCGSGSVTFTCNYTNQSPCGGTGGSSVGGSFTVVSLNIVDGSGKTISPANSNNVVIVGQSIGLTAQTCGGTFSNFQWTVDGSTFSNYMANSQTGMVVTTFPLTNSGVNFYWKDAGSKQVSCQATCGGVTCSTNVSLTVVRPTATIISKTGVVALDSAYGFPRLHYGVAIVGSQPGILFSNTVTMPSGYFNGGNTNYSIEWIQEVTSTLRREQTNDGSGAWYQLQSTSSVLDTTNPYPFDPAFPYPDTDDSPASDNLNNYQAVSYSDQFSMWLMFQPQGGQWVPLRVVNWNWSGAGTLSNGVWNLSNSSNAVDPVDSDSTTHPTWTTNISDFKWIKQ